MPLSKRTVGLIDVKPLECVGEVAEAATALLLASERTELPAYPRDVLARLHARGLMPSSVRQRELFELRSPELLKGGVHVSSVPLHLTPEQREGLRRVVLARPELYRWADRARKAHSAADSALRRRLAAR